ncbi:MAG: hypothetical protein ACHRXM_09330 [Isosphaerales bacterium]
MRTTVIHCSRCGATILGGHSILQIVAGELANRHDEPWIDLCGSCVDRFGDWLRSGSPHNGAAAAPTVQPAMVTVTR